MTEAVIPSEHTDVLVIPSEHTDVLVIPSEHTDVLVIPSERSESRNPHASAAFRERPAGTGYRVRP
jgi:hypothetical protein